MTRVGDGLVPTLAEPLRRIGLVARATGDGVPKVVSQIVEFAGARDIELIGEDHLAPQLPGDGPPLEATDLRSLDLLLTLGGDGTLLRGARMVADLEIPILGINLGFLGFLTALGADEVDEGLERLGRGELLLDLRFTLEGTVHRPDGSRGGTFWAMNDLVVHKGGVARVVRLDLLVGSDGTNDEIGSFSGDGVIVATPTGSTAYSLSAGGPVIAPSMECIVVTPISAHTLAMRPLVLPSDGVLTIRAVDRVDELVVTADGQVGIPLGPGDRVVVRRGSRPVTLVRFEGQTFFSTLRRKLNWAI
ncbi:MAG: NAD(+)/NADH kinase [Gemmatimonadales bacterium]|nr:MAG: NAD(+)/NADH kinase [Gemmatimonadales bacterium]